MRRLFSNMLCEEMHKNNDIFLISADLGYNLWDQIKEEFKVNFINPGSSEQLMIGMATGLAMENKIPLCYSITPFLLYRPFEFIRNYAHYEKIPIKLVGGGRNKDYGALGYTHWAEEDRDIMNVLSNIEVYAPDSKEDLKSMFHEFLYNEKPSYLNLRR